MSKYNIKLKNGNSILWTHSDSENFEQKKREFKDIGFEVEKVVESNYGAESLVRG